MKKLTRVGSIIAKNRLNKLTKDKRDLDISLSKERDVLAAKINEWWAEYVEPNITTVQNQYELFSFLESVGITDKNGICTSMGQVLEDKISSTIRDSLRLYDYMHSLDIPADIPANVLNFTAYPPKDVDGIPILVSIFKEGSQLVIRALPVSSEIEIPLGELYLSFKEAKTARSKKHE